MFSKNCHFEPFDFARYTEVIFGGTPREYTVQILEILPNDNYLVVIEGETTQFRAYKDSLSYL